MANKKYVSLARLSDFLDNIKEKYSQIGHKHSLSDLTDYEVDTELSSTSTNPVQNKALDAEFEAIGDAMGALELAIDAIIVPTKLSELTNDSNFALKSEIPSVPVKSVNSKTGAVVLSASDVGLGNVNNTSDANKPVSIAQAAALAQKADKTNGIYFIVGNSTTAGTWTGTSDDITEYYDGLTIAYLTNVAGISDGSTLNINGLGAKNVRRNVTNVTTNYAANSLIHLTYVTIDGTGYWQMADYDSNTKTTTGSSNKTGSKMYLIGGTSQSSSGVTTYSNKNVYIGTDNCLYSNGKKVATSADIPTDDYINTLIDAKLGVIENGTY